MRLTVAEASLRAFIHNRVLSTFVKGAGIIVALATLACAPPHATLPTPEQAYATKPAYNYPITNPYAATIVTVPAEMKVDYSSVPEPEYKHITLFKDREIPEGFWYQRGLNYGVLLQPRPAPLVYIISGTGADAHASIMRTLANILYSAGYSAILLPSPSNPNFIINASETYLPGSPSQDAHDLYQLMQSIDAEVAKKNTVTGHMLVGYSLGAWDAAFTSKLDSEQQKLRFSKVLLLNPPLSLYSSMKLLDDDLYRALRHGMNDADTFIKSVITRFSKLSPNGEAFDFQNENILLEGYLKYHPSDNRLATIIGLSFRLSAADMIFTSDVMRHSGYIFPKNATFTTSTDLNPYLAVAVRTSFSDYLNDVFYEEQRATHPGLTKQGLIAASSLEALAPYLQQSPHIGMITNADDIILAPGELAALTRLFPGRAVVFPSGGHLGNIALPSMAYEIIRFMKR